MVNFIRPLLIECLGYTSWPLRSSKEIQPFIEDVTERTCSHSSLGCLGTVEHVAVSLDSVSRDMVTYL